MWQKFNRCKWTVSFIWNKSIEYWFRSIWFYYLLIIMLWILNFAFNCVYFYSWLWKHTCCIMVDQRNLQHVRYMLTYRSVVTVASPAILITCKSYNANMQRYCYICKLLNTILYIQLYKKKCKNNVTFEHRLNTCFSYSTVAVHYSRWLRSNVFRTYMVQVHFSSDFLAFCLSSEICLSKYCFWRITD